MVRAFFGIFLWKTSKLLYTGQEVVFGCSFFFFLTLCWYKQTLPLTKVFRWLEREGKVAVWGIGSKFMTQIDIYFFFLWFFFIMNVYAYVLIVYFSIYFIFPFVWLILPMKCRYFSLNNSILFPQWVEGHRAQSANNPCFFYK